MSASALIQNSFDGELPLIARASGVHLYDTEGKEYIDGCSGAVVAVIGHGHTRVLEAMRSQAANATFTHRGAFTSESSESLAAEIADMTGFPGVWLVNSGSEATEAAIQFALQYYRETGRPERQGFLSHRVGYHGNTLGGLSLSGHARRSVVGSLAEEWTTLPTPFRLTSEVHRDPAFVTELLAGARAEFERTAGTIAGVVIEAVGGATLGVVVPPDGYLQGIRALCDEFDVLLILDEVMTGIARTGTMLAAEHWGIKADIEVVGKGLGAGYTPIAATLLNRRIIDAIANGSRRILGGHTYAANPLSAAISREVLAVVRDEQLVERARVYGALLGERLVHLAASHPSIEDVRGIGMMWGVQLTAAHPDAAEPTGARAARLSRLAAERGLIVYQATGGFNDAVSIAPPLTITEHEIDELVVRFERALIAFEANKSDPSRGGRATSNQSGATS